MDRELKRNRQQNFSVTFDLIQHMKNGKAIKNLECNNEFFCWLAAVMICKALNCNQDIFFMAVLNKGLAKLTGCN